MFLSKAYTAAIKLAHGSKSTNRSMCMQVTRASLWELHWVLYLVKERGNKRLRNPAGLVPGWVPFTSPHFGDFFSSPLRRKNKI